MNYIKISYLELEEIPKYYTALLELDDNGFCKRTIGTTQNTANKNDDLKNPDNPVSEWLKNKGGELTKDEIAKGMPITKEEFENVWQQVTREQRKN